MTGFSDFPVVCKLSHVLPASTSSAIQPRQIMEYFTSVQKGSKKGKKRNSIGHYVQHSDPEPTLTLRESRISLNERDKLNERQWKAFSWLRIHVTLPSLRSRTPIRRRWRWCGPTPSAGSACAFPPPWRLQSEEIKRVRATPQKQQKTTRPRIRC